LKEARKLRAELHKLAAGWRPGKATVAGYAERWLEELAEARDWRDARRLNMILRYHQALRLYIVPVLGSRKLSDVDAFAVKELRRRVPPSQSPYVLTVLASMYQEAIEDDVATHNPVRGMLPKRVERSETRHLSEDEFRRLVAIVRGHRLEGAVILGLCGLRISEAVSMTWGDMDLDTGEITVARQFFGELEAGQPRTFALSAFAVAALGVTDWPRPKAIGGARPDDDTPIQTTIYRTAFHPDRLRQEFRKFATANAFDPKFHTLRHTFATLQLTAGADIRTVSYDWDMPRQP
jgi:integrase